MRAPETMGITVPSVCPVSPVNSGQRGRTKKKYKMPAAIENDACQRTATLRLIPLLDFSGPRATSNGHLAGRASDRVAEDRGFEPLRAINPTRVPGERHRP